MHEGAPWDIDQKTVATFLYPKTLKNGIDTTQALQLNDGFIFAIFLWISKLINNLLERNRKRIRFTRSLVILKGCDNFIDVNFRRLIKNTKTFSAPCIRIDDKYTVKAIAICLLI